MLSSVLKSARAIAVNIEIMRAFVRLRDVLLADDELRAKVDAMEQDYDEKFAVVFTALRALMDEEAARRTRPRKAPIGFPERSDDVVEDEC